MEDSHIIDDYDGCGGLSTYDFSKFLPQLPLQTTWHQEIGRSTSVLYVSSISTKVHDFGAVKLDMHEM